MVGKLTPDHMVSASVIPALLGQSPYMTRNELLARAVATLNGKPPAPFTPGEAADWGNALEPVILSEAAQRLGLANVRLDHDEPFFHPTLPLACSLDGSASGTGQACETGRVRGLRVIGQGPVMLDGPGVLEAKLTSNMPEDEPAAHRGPLQLQAQLMVTGYKWGCIAVLYRGIELRLFVYGPDKAMQAEIAAAVNDFEARKKGPDWYPAETSADADAAYATGEADLPTVDLDVLKLGKHLEDLVAARAVKQDMETRIDAAEAAIKDAMGAHTKAIGTVGNSRYRVAWPMRNYKAQPEKITPAKPARTVRQSTLTLKMEE